MYENVIYFICFSILYDFDENQYFTIVKWMMYRSHKFVFKLIIVKIIDFSPIFNFYSRNNDDVHQKRLREIIRGIFNKLNHLTLIFLFIFILFIFIY